MAHIPTQFINDSTPTTTSFGLTAELSCNESLHRGLYDLGSQTQLTVLTVSNAIMSGVGTIFNALIILSTFNSEQTTNTNILALLSLTTADILVCGIFQPLYVYRLNHPEQNCTFVIVQIFIGHLSMIASLNSVLLITIDRVVAVYKPLKYIVWITSKRLYKTTAALWGVAILISTFRVCDPTKEKTKFVVYGYAFIVTLFIVIFCVAIYTTSILVNRKIQREINIFPCTNRRPQLKATKSTLLVLGLFLLSWLPHLIAPTIISPEPMTYAKALPWLNTCAFCNSFANPFVYYLRYRVFRQAFKKFIRKSHQSLTMMCGR